MFCILWSILLICSGLNAFALVTAIRKKDFDMVVIFATLLVFSLVATGIIMYTIKNLPGN